MTVNLVSIDTRWGVFREGNEVHVAPLGDIWEHLLDGTQCICRPQRENYGHMALITHNSFDGREEFEGGPTL